MVNFTNSMVSLLLKWLFGISMVLFFNALTPNCITLSLYEPRELQFAGQNWVLPLTVEQAVTNYHLQFRRPNIFRTTLQGNGSMHVEFPYKSREYPLLGELASDSLKFRDRIVHTYCFSFSDTLSTYDSLRAVLQKTISKSFTVHEDTMRIHPEDRKSLLSKGIVHYEIVQRDDESYVAIRHQPRQAAYYPAKLQVFFFYGLPYKEIYHRLTVF